jgi:hypothetical protein
MNDQADFELRRALREEAYRPPVLLTAATLRAQLEAADTRRRAVRPWVATLMPIAGLVFGISVVAFGLISTQSSGSNQSPTRSAACDESPATRHGNWWVEMGGPKAFFNIEPGTRLSSADGRWLLFTRFDPDAGPTEGVSIEAQRLGSEDRVAGRLNSRVGPNSIYRFDEPAPSLPGGWYLFELDIASPGCWLITGSVGGRVVGSATVDVGLGRPGPTGPFDSLVPVPITAPPNPTPLASPSVRCGQPPIFKGSYLIQLNCPGAIAAALAAIPPEHPPISSLAFAWGLYCPAGTPCPTSDGVLLETGYVVVSYIDGAGVLVAVHGEPNHMVVATDVNPLPTGGPGLE